MSGKPISAFLINATLGRLHRVAYALREGKWVTAAALAEKEECSIKTIYRTMDFLEFTLGWKLVRGKGCRDGFRLISEGNPPLRPPIESPCTTT